MKRFLLMTVFLGIFFFPHVMFEVHADPPKPVAPATAPGVVPPGGAPRPGAPSGVPGKKATPPDTPGATDAPKAGPGQGLTLDKAGNKLPSNLPRFGLSRITDPLQATESFMIRFVINPIFILSGAIAILMIIYSAGRLITGRGEEAGLTAAKTTLTWAAIGLLLIMVAFTIVNNLIRIIQSQI